MRLGDLDALKPKIDKFIGYLDEDMIERIKVVIDNAPTIIWCSETPNGLPFMDLRPRPTGEWIYNDKLNKYYCKDCGLFEPITKEEVEEGVKLPNFCEQCGADMRKPNCVTCDHFGNCEGCERSGEE